MTTESLPPFARQFDPDSATKRFIGLMSMVVAMRIAILVIGLVALRNAPAGSVPAFNMAHHWMGWDARHYYEVALNGYAPTRDGKIYDGWNSFALIAFFPIVPLIGRALSTFMPLDVAMVAFSNICSIIGFGFLYDWARRMTTERTAAICLLLTATFPGAVSFAAGMTEGLFLMLTAIALWLLQRKRWYAAAIAAGVATATRPTGVALAMVVPLYVCVFAECAPLSKRLTQLILLSVISFSGLALYEGFIWQRYQSPTAYFEAQTNWGRLDQERSQDDATHGVQRYSFEFFKDRLTRPQSWNRIIAIGIFVICILGLWKPMGIPRELFLMPIMILLMTTLPGRGLRASSVPRYESAAAPLFLLIALWLSPNRRSAGLVTVLLIQFAIQIYYATLFPREIWVG